MPHKRSEQGYKWLRDKRQAYQYGFKGREGGKERKVAVIKFNTDIRFNRLKEYLGYSSLVINKNIKKKDGTGAAGSTASKRKLQGETNLAGSRSNVPARRLPTTGPTRTTTTTSTAT